MENKKALIIFWKILIAEYNSSESVGMDREEAIEFANDGELLPIDTRFCIQILEDSGTWLLEASGSKIIRVIEGGEINEN